MTIKTQEHRELLMHEPTDSAVLQRLIRLERASRWWRVVAGAAIALCAVVVVMGASTRAGRTAVAEVFAREVILVDRTQTPRASMTIGKEGGPSLLLLDQQGKVRVGLTVLDDGRPSLGLLDAQGQSRVVLALESNGSPRLRFLDERGHVVWSAP
jgi:hypothetical protein